MFNSLIETNLFVSNERNNYNFTNVLIYDRLKVIAIEIYQLDQGVMLVNV